MGANLPNGNCTKETSGDTPFFSLYNERIRELLDAVDRLRDIKITKEGIQLPTIVVVGDQSSGKSSVLESLAGISLPRGQGICTRVPLIMRLQGSNYNSKEPELFLEYQGKTVPTSEGDVAAAINAGTEEIAGKSKGVSDNPITLIVKKRGVPDLTMVDLPGITRVPVHGQPDDIYEQISKIIMEYVRPKETIILNVLSATVDFPTCESIRMSQSVDKSGKRTLAVVTKADKAPEGLLEKVTADDVNIGLGYVCVRNRIGDESYEEAREEEASLFETHPLLSMIDKSMVGIPVLAQRLVRIQAGIIGKCLPEIIKTIDEKHSQSVSELNSMPRKLNTVAEAMTAFVQIIGSAKDSLSKLLVRGELDEFPDDKTMHCHARIVELLNEYSEQLHSGCSSDDDDDDDESSEKSNPFLLEEMSVLEECAHIGLPNFLPHSAFTTLLQRKVKEIAQKPIEFTRKVWNYIEGIVVRILVSHSESYPQLQPSFRRAAYNMITKLRERSYSYVEEMVQMEMIANYTSHPEYMNNWIDLMKYQQSLKDTIVYGRTRLEIPSFGVVDVQHLREYSTKVEQAFDMKMRITAYWKIVMLRLVDSMALHLLNTLKKLVNEEMEAEVVNEFMGANKGGIERLLEEAPAIANKREKLTNSIKLLDESKEILAKVMDRIAIEADHAD